MELKRRDFLKKGAMAGALAPLGIKELLAAKHFDKEELYRGNQISIGLPPGRTAWKPLEEVSGLINNPGKEQRIQVWDGAGNRYFETGAGVSFSFQVGGALGYHKVTLHDSENRMVDWAVFQVDCHTEIVDEGGEFTAFLETLYETLTTSYAGWGRTVRYNHKYYTCYSSWFQDHVFVAEGMKYFTDELKSGIDLYADGQREDGMIWDNYKHPYPELQSYWEYRFNYGGFTYRPEDPRSSALFVRIPVENIGEHTFLEGVYYTWKATGDSEWMKTMLDPALKAVKFATSSPWYWSEEYQLLKRPFSIDRWDFQSDLDAKITGKDFMGADLERTRYGVMFGDNICLANGCSWLAEMLEHAGRNQEAGEMKELGRGIRERVNKLSWNGSFYRHWVPVENEQDLDFGVDTESQVTLSNAMALLRGVDHEKAVEIIRTYQGIREEMPASSPGEWYMCFPPFERGWHLGKWEYMNGGVSPILAGDLALGAFTHGFDEYGVDILRRLDQLAVLSGKRLRGCYKGKMPEAGERSFSTLRLEAYANADLQADHPEAKQSFGSADADLRNLPTGRQEFEGVPFRVIDPARNQRRASMIIREGSVSVAIGREAGSIYLLHTTDGKSVAGILHLHYSDGSSHSRYIREGSEIAHFWYPVVPEQNKGIPSLVLAWKGPARVVKEVGVCAFGMTNPHPDKEIESMEFYNPGSGKWAVLGITLSDSPVYFRPTIVSTIPDHWASAHVIKALMEGLAGIRNEGLAFDRLRLSPRWEAAGIGKARATAKYVCSGGYASYTYEKSSPRQYKITFTGNARETDLELGIPEGNEVSRMLVDGKENAFRLLSIEKNHYAQLRIEGIGVHHILVDL